MLTHRPEGPLSELPNPETPTTPPAGKRLTSPGQFLRTAQVRGLRYCASAFKASPWVGNPGLRKDKQETNTRASSPARRNTCPPLGKAQAATDHTGHLGSAEQNKQKH